MAILAGWRFCPRCAAELTHLGSRVECPHCGERVYEENVYSWRPDRDDPKLLLIYCPDCGDRVEVNHV